MYGVRNNVECEDATFELLIEICVVGALTLTYIHVVGWTSQNFNVHSSKADLLPIGIDQCRCQKDT
jgi:hypothetical protein